MSIHTLPKLAIALVLILAPMAAQADGPWEGRWSTNWSDIHFLQQDNLVYGQYMSGGYMIGLVDPSGQMFRGTWVHRSDGTWGVIEFRMAEGGASFEGNWAMSRAFFDAEGASEWSGERLSVTPEFSTDFEASYAWPGAYDFDDPATNTWLTGGALPE